MTTSFDIDRIIEEANDSTFDTLTDALSKTDHHRLPLYLLDSRSDTFEPFDAVAVKIVKGIAMVKLEDLKAKL